MSRFNKYLEEKCGKKKKKKEKVNEDNLNESIFYFAGIFDAGKVGKKKITLPVVADDEVKAKKKFEDMIDLHVKNGQLPKGKLSNIKLETKLG